VLGQASGRPGKGVGGARFRVDIVAEIRLLRVSVAEILAPDPWAAVVGTTAELCRGLARGARCVQMSSRSRCGPRARLREYAAARPARDGSRPRLRDCPVLAAQLSSPKEAVTSAYTRELDLEEDELAAELLHRCPRWQRHPPTRTQARADGVLADRIGPQMEQQNCEQLVVGAQELERPGGGARPLSARWWTMRR
jgi:hypothetical protein